MRLGEAAGLYDQLAARLTVEAPNPVVKVIARLPSTIPLPIEAGARHAFALRRHNLKHFDPATGRKQAVP
jgi:multiple sugar transport system ATP-binding protein